MGDGLNLPRVRVETALGGFTVQVHVDKAPISAEAFLAYVRAGYLDGSSVFRILNDRNQPNDEHKVRTVQWGWYERKDNTLPIGRPPHEPTSVTGLRHLRGTMSMARRGTGTPGSEYFIILRDEPELDFGGRRNPDGQGFAAFAEVVEGFDTLERLHERGEDEQFVRDPVPVLSVKEL
ncbi:peptidylprolyl isomerase [Bosea caraganae]|uniref:peptidylprolyl isomerase n=1 Tax=Bosea caraganae TaxID=2763117 RepID=A0A370LCY0_9HYPH|nr:peptidylprolyl isomerase [Bosea caraganae]RDJ27745.1 peptidylprolyl isomerase [Bosea caraganae]RDJ29758.1 peptidylprolyl isomerase [Bosea caraganae]